MSKYKFDKDHAIINDFFDKIIIEIDERYELDNYAKKQRRQTLSLWARTSPNCDSHLDLQQNDGSRGNISSGDISQGNSHWQNPTEMEIGQGGLGQNQGESYRSADMLHKRPQDDRVAKMPQGQNRHFKRKSTAAF